MAGSEIIVCGRRFDIGHPVRTFMDANGYNAYLEHRTDDPSKGPPTHPAPGMKGRVVRYRHRRLLGRDRSITNLKRAVRQVVTHLDGCMNARLCFHVLHNQHGLSVHFMIDNDGTIYQTLDLVDCAFHAAGVNETSIGIELQNRGDALRFPGAYRTERPTVLCRIHDRTFLAYDFTPRQYVAMVHLGRALSRILDIPLRVPQATTGEPIWSTIDTPRRFDGFIGHYHLTPRKWDPGPWDFQRLFRNIGSKITFPLTTIAAKSDRRTIKKVAQQYYEAERDGTGHFPVGPLGESRLWHGGVHLPGKKDAPVYAPIHGRVVAAKSTLPTTAGSANFVLLRHVLETSRRSIPFFSLHFHLRSESAGQPTTPPWFEAEEAGRLLLAQGRTALLRRLVEAGELIGHVGEAGPAEVRRPQIHFAIFAEEELGALIDPGWWEVIVGTETNRFCRNQEIIDRIDRPSGGQPRDGLLSRRELGRFYRQNPRRAEMRKVVVRHLSEWTLGDWQSQLETSPDFAELPADVRRRMVAEQIEPTLWWTPAVAEHAGLPANGVVYSYHPIGFLEWYAKVMEEKASARAAGIEVAKGNEQIASTADFKLDFESTAEMTDDEDEMSVAKDQKLRLEEMIDGYPD